MTGIASMPTVHNPYRALLRMLFLIVVISFAYGAAGMVMNQELVALIALVFGGSFLLLAVILSIKGRFDVRKIQRLINGENLLAQWEYTDNSLETYARADYEKDMSKGKKILIGIPLVGALAAYLTGDKNDIQYGILAGLGLGIVIFLVIYAQAKDFLNQSMQPPYRAYLSRTSVFINGKFIDWSSFGFSFASAVITELDQHGRQSIKIKYFVRGRYGTEEKHLFIPIPPGKKEEAEKIIGLLK